MSLDKEVRIKFWKWSGSEPDSVCVLRVLLCNYCCFRDICCAIVSQMSFFSALKKEIGWLIWPVKLVPDMTYNVLGGTLNLALPSPPPVSQMKVKRCIDSGAAAFQTPTQMLQINLTPSGPTRSSQPLNHIDITSSTTREVLLHAPGTT